MTRVLVIAVAVFALFSFVPGPAPPGSPPPQPVPTNANPIHPFTGWPNGGVFDTLFTPLTRWDAGNYLAIVRDGYGRPDAAGASSLAAFFPLYPATVRLVAVVFGSSYTAMLIAAYLVSLGAFFTALFLMYRLVELELGPGYASDAILLLAIFPASFYFSSPYSESLFLACSVAAFYAARTGRWAAAGIAGALASATRLAGVALVVPVVVLYLYGPRLGAEVPAASAARRLLPRHPIRIDAVWLALVPLGLVAYTLYLQVAFGDGLAWKSAQRTAFARASNSPFTTVVDGARAAWQGIRRLAEMYGPATPAGLIWSWEAEQAVVAVLEFTVLCLAVVALIGVFRRLPFAYGAYALTMMLLLLSSKISTSPPIDIGRPLQSLHRFVAVIFPFFVWLALVARERGRTAHVAAAFGIVLGLFTSLFSLSYWLV